MESGKPPYEICVLVCTNRRDDPSRPSCGLRGGVEIQQELKRRIKERGLHIRIRVSQAGCLDLCAQGPNVLVYPEGRLYSGVAIEDLDRILNDLPGFASEDH